MIYQLNLVAVCLPVCVTRWSGPYLRRMIESVKATHPNTPLTLYANGSGGLLERLGATGADVVGLDWTVDMADARQRLGSKQSVQVGVPVWVVLGAQGSGLRSARCRRWEGPGGRLCTCTSAQQAHQLNS